MVDFSGLAQTPQESWPRRHLRLLDAVALTTGYALAALLMRCFWPAPVNLTVGAGVLLSLIYVWLGLIMSGPFLLLLERRQSHDEGAGPEPTVAERPPPGRTAEPVARLARSRYTRAERAWMSIGAYWIGATAFLIPTRLSDSPLGLLLILQLLAALGLWVVVPRRRPPVEARSSWTHRLSLGLLASWPLVWGALIYLVWGR